MQHSRPFCICCKQGLTQHLSPLAATFTKKRGGVFFLIWSSFAPAGLGARLNPLAKKRCQRRRDFDNLPGRRQAGRPGINLENDNVVRELVLRQQVFSARSIAKCRGSLPPVGIPPAGDRVRFPGSMERIRNAVVSPVGDVEKLSVWVHGGFGYVVPAGESGRQRRRRSHFPERPFFHVRMRMTSRRAQFAHRKNKFPIRIKHGVPWSMIQLQSGERGFIRVSVPLVASNL